jgi:hypothetical protein
MVAKPVHNQRADEPGQLAIACCRVTPGGCYQTVTHGVTTRGP